MTTTTRVSIPLTRSSVLATLVVVSMLASSAHACSSTRSVTISCMGGPGFSGEALLYARGNTGEKFWQGAGGAAFRVGDAKDDASYACVTVCDTQGVQQSGETVAGAAMVYHTTGTFGSDPTTGTWAGSDGPVKVQVDLMQKTSGMAHKSDFQAPHDARALLRVGDGTVNVDWTEKTLELDVTALVPATGLRDGLTYWRTRADPIYRTNENKREDTINAWLARGGASMGLEPKMVVTFCSADDAGDGGDAGGDGDAGDGGVGDGDAGDGDAGDGDAGDGDAGDAGDAGDGDAGDAGDGDAGETDTPTDPCTIDDDGDGITNCIDMCPSDGDKQWPGFCGCGQDEVNADGDSVPDCLDGCPADPLKTAPGMCGCGVADTDSDGDGLPDCVDTCPGTTKPYPGQCGCDVEDVDEDEDGVASCNDECDDDPLKTAPGLCGCGYGDDDEDGDGALDCNDECDDDPLKTEPGLCGCGTVDVDTDGDSVLDCHEDCDADPNKQDPGLCGCGTADTDTDDDGTPDCNDDCPNDPLKTEPGLCGCGEEEGCAVSLPPTDSSMVIQGPYLMSVGSDTIAIRWRSRSNTNGVVFYGLAAGSFHHSVTNDVVGKEHVVRLTGLQPSTRYYYTVGSSSNTGASGTAYYFQTSPPLGAAASGRFLVGGDPGYAASKTVYEGAKSYMGSRREDAWILLGDNAYNYGTDAEYTSNMFNVHKTDLRTKPIWTTLGNHDAYVKSSSQSGAYFNLFTLPKQGEAGGYPSNNAAYHSWNYGDIHFVSLDSWSMSRSSTGAMISWLRQDLEHCKSYSKWLVAYWHHPAYSKGSHNSDYEVQSIEMRQRALPLLEAAGLDLLLNGHSHGYERSALIKGHHGSSSSFSSSTHVKEGGMGTSAAPYHKSTGLNSNSGFVAVTFGSSGRVRKHKHGLRHQALVELDSDGKKGLEVLASIVLDVDSVGNRLSASLVTQAGVVLDHFVIVKE